MSSQRQPDRIAISGLIDGWNDQLTPYMRAVAAGVGAGLIALGWQPFFDPNAAAYDRPVFEGIKNFASLEAWGLGFWLPALFLLFSALSGRALTYTWGVMLGTVTLVLWAYFVIRQKVIDPDALLTSGAFGYYVLALVATVAPALSPRQLVGEKQVYGKRPDGLLVPLRSVEDPARRDVG